MKNATERGKNGSGSNTAGTAHKKKTIRNVHKKKKIDIQDKTMKEFKAGKNEAGQRLDKYLKKILPNASMGFIYKMLRKKNIKLNDKKASGTENCVS